MTVVVIVLVTVLASSMQYLHLVLGTASSLIIVNQYIVRSYAQNQSQVKTIHAPAPVEVQTLNKRTELALYIIIIID